MTMHLLKIYNKGQKTYFNANWVGIIKRFPDANKYTLVNAW